MPEGELSAALISMGLATQLIGKRIIYRKTVTSTMDVARQEARRGVAEGTVVIAGEQTAAATSPRRP